MIGPKPFALSKPAVVQRSPVLISISVLYFLPDYRHIVNEFFWQTHDHCPAYPRLHRFLDYWRREIDAVIKEVRIEAGSPARPIRHITWSYDG